MKQSLFECFRDRHNPYFRYDCNHVSNKVVISVGFYLHLLTNKQTFEDYYLSKSPIINKIEFVALAMSSISDHSHRVFWIQIPLSVKKLVFIWILLGYTKLQQKKEFQNYFVIHWSSIVVVRKRNLTSKNGFGIQKVTITDATKKTAFTNIWTACRIYE